MKIGIFGGAFNPIHIGHLITVEEISEKLKLDKVLFIPAYNPPHKKGLVAYAHRKTMVELAIKNNLKFELSEIEKQIKGKSFTIEALKILSKMHPRAKLYLIIGSDEYLELNTWKEPCYLKKYAKLIIMKRPTYQTTMRNTIYESFIDVTQIGIASKEIRRALKLGNSVKYKISDEVFNYIKKNKLYT